MPPNVQVTDLLPAGLTLRVVPAPAREVTTGHRRLDRRHAGTTARRRRWPSMAQVVSSGAADQHGDHQPRRPVRPQHRQQYRQRHRDPAAGRPGRDQDRRRPDAQRRRHDHLHRSRLNNIGPNAATNVQVNDLLPAGLTFVSADAQPGDLRQRHRRLDRGHDVPTAAAPTLTSWSHRDQSRRRRPTRRRSPAATSSTPHRQQQASATETPQQADLASPRRSATPTPNVGDTITFTVTLTQRRARHRHQRAGDRPAAGRADLRVRRAEPGDLRQRHRAVDRRHRGPRCARTLTITARVVSPDPQTNTATISRCRPVRPEPRQQHGQRHRDAAAGRPGDQDGEQRRRPTSATQITFTVTLTNTGPTGHRRAGDRPVAGGPDLRVGDASQGTYNGVTGLWNVGTVAGGRRRR